MARRRGGHAGPHDGRRRSAGRIGGDGSGRAHGPGAGGPTERLPCHVGRERVDHRDRPDHGGFGIYGDQFQIAISRNGGTYRTLAWEHANLVDTPDPDGVVRMRSVVVPYNFTFRLFGSPRGNATYRIRARMRDHAGNWSRWMTGPVLRTGLILPTSKSITYSSGWTQAANPLGGSAYAATSPGETATLTFTGRSIAWMAHVGAAYGTAEIRIDGMLVATLDQSRSVTNSFCCSFSKTWGTRATHVLTITPVGPPDHPKVDILGFLILS